MSQIDIDQVIHFFSFMLDLSPSHETPDFSFFTTISDLYDEFNELEDIIKSQELKKIIKPLNDLYGDDTEAPIKKIFEFLKNKSKGTQHTFSHPSAPLSLTNTLTHNMSVVKTALKRADDLSHHLSQVPTPPSIEGVKVIRLLGRGAHADIFLAERPALPDRGRIVLKCTRTASCHHMTHSAENDALKSLQSPHIIRLYKSGEFKNHPHYSSWLELEYCAYGSLSNQISLQPSRPLQMRWIYQLVMAIKDLHQAGFVHRDLKPSNILITHMGVLKVSDLGVSKRLAPDSKGTLTEAGSMIGTMLYMSPEQVSGVHIDHRSDLWAIAAIIYELIIGVPLIEAKNPSLASHQILKADFNLDLPNLDQEFQRILSRCLKLNPDDRYQSVDELWVDLKPIIMPLLIKETLELQHGWWAFLKSHADSLLKFCQKNAYNRYNKSDELANSFLAEIMPEELLKPISLPLYELNGLMKELCDQHITYLLACEKRDVLTTDATSPQSSVLKLTRETEELKEHAKRYLDAFLEQRSSKVGHWNKLFNPFGHISAPPSTPHTLTQHVLDVEYELAPRTIKRQVMREVKRRFCWVFSCTHQEVFEREYTYLNPQIKQHSLASFELSFCPPGEQQVTPAKAPYKVSFPQGFWMMTTPVTEGLWSRVMGDERHDLNSRRPVTRVMWREALEFANRLSQQDGLEAVYHFDDQGVVLFSNDANGYRLPSEAAWEYAARAHSTLCYSGSEELKEVAWSQQDGVDGPQDVAQKSPNAWGLYDMSGNISEWCADIYIFSNERCVAHDINLTPPQRLSTADEPRPSRGGCWSSNGRGCLISKRQKRSPLDSLPNVGFRLMIHVSSSM